MCVYARVVITDCAVCESKPTLAYIDSHLALGLGAKAVEMRALKAGLRVTEYAILKHMRHTALSVFRSPAKAEESEGSEESEESKAPVIPRRQRPSEVTPPVKPYADLAEAIHGEALKLVNMGKGGITVRDGLAAAALLDKRREKEEDRVFVFKLAQLLSGGGGGAPSQLTEGAVEAEYRDVTPEPATPNPLLAPAHLISVD